MSIGAAESELFIVAAESELSIGAVELGLSFGQDDNVSNRSKSKELAELERLEGDTSVGNMFRNGLPRGGEGVVGFS